jgi:hypothetical protein
VCLFAVLVCALSAISGQLRARARLQRQPGASTHTHTHTHTPNTANAHTRISLSRCVSVCVFVCVYTLAHTHSHTHTHTIQIALIAGGASLAFIVLSASLVAMYLRNRKIYREYSVLKEQNEAELELDRIGASVWN